MQRLAPYCARVPLLHHEQLQLAAAARADAAAAGMRPHCPHRLLFGFLSPHRSNTVERSLRKRAGDAEVALAATEQQVAQAALSLALARPLSFFRFEV